jgi:EAL domain-containing protein (putative c-di-GMP-specific phosphodiesterase class I)
VHAPPAQPEGHPPVTRDDLERALNEREIRVVYQPKLDCRTGSIVALEGLARWHDARLGEITPSVFVPLAETSGLIDHLTELVFGEAIGWFGEHFAGRAIVLCLNVSARSLDDVGFADWIEALCRGVHLDPSQLVLELTETSSVPDQALARDVLTRLRIKGMAVALDDLGSGHSSLVQLARQPFSELKIDRSFVSHAADSVDARTIVRAIVGLGHGLGMRVTAEGVEDAAGFEAITGLGCDVVQGTFIAPPMEGDDVLEWIDARAPLLRAEPREAL